MNEEIKILIANVNETGRITSFQRENILRRAAELGEDLDVVKMLLDSVHLKTVHSSLEDTPEKRMKCPNCGAVIYDNSFKCPDCGFVFQKETPASVEARANLNKLREQLKECSEANSFWDDPIERQVSVINSFTMPMTKEGLSQFLEFACSNYLGTSNDSFDFDQAPLRSAWHGKVVQAYNSLARLGSNDPSVGAMLERYSSLISKEEKKLSSETKYWILIGAAAILFLIMFWVIGMSGLFDM